MGDRDWGREYLHAFFTRALFRIIVILVAVVSCLYVFPHEVYAGCYFAYERHWPADASGKCLVSLNSFYYEPSTCKVTNIDTWPYYYTTDCNRIICTSGCDYCYPAALNQTGGIDQDGDGHYFIQTDCKPNDDCNDGDANVYPCAPPSITDFRIIDNDISAISGGPVWIEATIRNNDCRNMPINWQITLTGRDFTKTFEGPNVPTDGRIRVDVRGVRLADMQIEC